MKEAICYFFVSGNVSIERPNISGVIDYGDGDCDNLAIFTTSDGEVIEILLDLCKTLKSKLSIVFLIHKILMGYI